MAYFRVFSLPFSFYYFPSFVKLLFGEGTLCAMNSIFECLSLFPCPVFRNIFRYSTKVNFSFLFCCFSFSFFFWVTNFPVSLYRNSGTDVERQSAARKVKSAYLGNKPVLTIRVRRTSINKPDRSV
ncbi:Uncharacterized protein APZ42_002919 [Daphnia magna]|uniref:Uncharacterized protein n=1 Tax=Daphnia magna TaxID=35525 RepID=A0A164HYF5_9CRUS|nr:Uncharacterized protein APZ42_002919 [Daphnia magna]